MRAPAGGAAPLRRNVAIVAHVDHGKTTRTTNPDLATPGVRVSTGDVIWLTEIDDVTIWETITRPWNGSIPDRSTGALVADRPGRTTANTIYDLQERGEIFTDTGTPVYVGMICANASRVVEIILDAIRLRKRILVTNWHPKRET